jgi:hypothetical protein
VLHLNASAAIGAAVGKVHGRAAGQVDDAGWAALAEDSHVLMMPAVVLPPPAVDSVLGTMRAPRQALLGARARDVVHPDGDAVGAAEGLHLPGANLGAAQLSTHHSGVRV